MNFKPLLRLSLLAVFFCGLVSAQAAETVKIGFIDVLSGPFALTWAGLLETAA